jgi:hypothetical protein
MNAELKLVNIHFHKFCNHTLYKSSIYYHKISGEKKTHTALQRLTHKVCSLQKTGTRTHNFIIIHLLIHHTQCRLETSIVSLSFPCKNNAIVVNPLVKLALSKSRPIN